VASDVGVGDSTTPFVFVAPADVDTVASLAVYPPTGLSFIITATGGDLEPIAGSDDLQQRWEADQPVTFTAPGRWVLHWDVTGTGEGAEDLTVFVSPAPLPGGPTWAPGLTRVAVYVPRLTVDTITPGDGVELGTRTAYSPSTPCGRSTRRICGSAPPASSSRPLTTPCSARPVGGLFSMPTRS
jgi:hypothetical protein